MKEKPPYGGFIMVVRPVNQGDRFYAVREILVVRYRAIEAGR